MVKKIIKVKKVSKKDEYTAVLKVFGKLFTSKGKTILEAIEKLEPGNAKSTSILTLQRDGKSRERVLPHPMTAGCFGQISPTLKAIRMKQLIARFDV